jgi:hypothetical protein
MSNDLTNEKHQVHELIDHLPPAQLAAVAGLLKAMLDPVSLAISNAPVGDEPETDEERRAVAEAKEWLRDHPGIPFEEVLADFGLTLNDLEDPKQST